MGEHVINPAILLKLQRRQGYDWCRVRRHPLRSEVWIAEIKRGKWRILLNQNKDYRTFTTPEQAYIALEGWRDGPFT